MKFLSLVLALSFGALAQSLDSNISTKVGGCARCATNVDYLSKEDICSAKTILAGKVFEDYTSEVMEVSSLVRGSLSGSELFLFNLPEQCSIRDCEVLEKAESEVIILLPGGEYKDVLKKSIAFDNGVSVISLTNANLNKIKRIVKQC